jgi:hypothetical protein
MVTDPRIQALATISLKLAEFIRRVYPVEGEPWLMAGESKEQALQPFRDLLRRLGACLWVQDDKGIHPLERSAAPELLEALHTVFAHYGWIRRENGEIGLYMDGTLDRRKVPWTWPGVPILPRGLLERLERAARSLAPASQTALEETPTASKDTAKTGGAAAGAVALKPDDLAILDAHKTSMPATINLYDLEAVTGISRRTLGKRIAHLIQQGLVCRPIGKRGGTTLTSQGLNLLNSAISH